MVDPILLIEKKLRKFSKKYYLNQIFKGLIFCIIVSIFLIFSFLLFEYIFYLNTSIKFFVLLFLILFFFFSFFILIFIPVFKYFGVLKGLTEKEKNEIIVDHFPDIKDQLINIIELKDQNFSDFISNELVYASIDQKVNNIKFYSFAESISFKKNLKFIYVFLATILFTIILNFVFPDFIKSSTYRLINFNTRFEKPSPYIFDLLNENLNVGKGDDFTIRVKITGKTQTDYLYLFISGKDFLMKRDSLNFYSYKFNNINNDILFQFKYDKYYSKVFKLDILEKPILNYVKIKVIKPVYTSLKNDDFENVTELLVPQGSQLIFDINAYKTDTVFFFEAKDSISRILLSEKNKFKFSGIYNNDNLISFSLNNKYFTIHDYLKINIKTIKDEFPSISVKQVSDSSDFTRFYFKGDISDDYGFSKLNFVLKNKDKIDTTIELNISKNVQYQEFFYAFDFNLYKNKYNQIDYFFEIFDNDGVNGPKSAISETFSFEFPDINDIEKYQNNEFDSIQNLFSNSMNSVNMLKNELNDLKKKLLNSDLTEWERKEIEKNITTKKQDIETELEKLKDKNDELNNFLKSFTEQDKEILQKQDQIQDLLKDLFSDDLKKLLDEFNKMLQDLNKDQLNKQKEKLDISLDDLSKQLDKNLQLLKRFQIEQKLNLLKNDLEDLNKEQMKSVQDSENKFDKEHLKINQDSLKSKAEDIQSKYSDILKLNESLDDKMNLMDFKNDFEEIKKEYSNTLENLDNSNKKKTKESIKNNSENLKNLNFSFSQMIQSLFMKQQTENLDNLLQILDNLVVYSFNQEDLIKQVDNRNFTSVSYGIQKKLFSDFDIIKDSLYTLAKREPSIDKTINNQLVQIQNYFLDINDDYENNQIPTVLINQQRVLTSVNELSLFISEVIKKIQENMAKSMPGNQNCNKPGNNPNPNSMQSSLQSMQKSLQQQLEKLMQMMKNGEQGKAVNGELGKAISQQEAMHNLLQKLMNQGSVGSNAYETLKQADQLLDKIKDDILRNKISNNTIERQKQILTRLLEAEKAENERDLDEKRKSNTAQEQFMSKTAKQFDNKNSIDNFEEKLIKNKLIFNSFYQKKYQNYSILLDSINGESIKDRVGD